MNSNTLEKELKNMDHSTAKRKLIELIDTLTESQVLYTLSFLTLMFKKTK